MRCKVSNLLLLPTANMWPAAFGRALLGADAVIVISSFLYLPPALDHMPCLASAVGLLRVRAF